MNGAGLAGAEAMQAGAPCRPERLLGRESAIRSPSDGARHRHRLSQDLHDHTGQAIAILLLELHGLGPFIQCAQGREHLDRIRRHVDQMGSDLHRLAVNLRPTLLERGGLAEACRTRVEQFRRACPVAVDFATTGDCGHLPEPIAAPLFNLFQEALTNIIRHGQGVSRVAMRLARRKNAVVVIVADDGLPRARTGGGCPGSRLGLAGMRTRVAALGGRLRIMRPAARGWVVCASVPLAEAFDSIGSAHVPDLLGR